MATAPSKPEVYILIELGKKADLFGLDKLRPITGINVRPTVMPSLKEGEKVVSGYNQGLGERMFVCESLEDMQELYDAYARGGALQITWYAGKDPGFITVISSSSVPEADSD